MALTLSGTALAAGGMELYFQAKNRRLAPGLFMAASKPDTQAKDLLRHPFACASGFDSTGCL